MLYLCPSRGRPKNIRELLESWEATRTHAELWICVDSDDPQVVQYRKIQMPSWATLHVGQRLRLGPTLNLYAARYLNQQYMAANRGNIIGFLGDDHRPRTPGWDQVISDTAKQTGTSVLYGDDRIQGPNLPTAVALTTDIVKTLGYMVPPGAIHLYLDNFWLYIGKSIGRLKYLPGVVIEHVHPITGKVPSDPGYAEVNSSEMYAHDEKVFNDWKRDEGDKAIARLLELTRT